MFLSHQLDVNVSFFLASLKKGNEQKQLVAAIRVKKDAFQQFCFIYICLKDI